MLKSCLYMLACFMLMSCSYHNNSGNVAMPNWVYGDTPSGKVCYVGSSKPHINGIPFQRALAVSRAIEGIARQKGVSVNVDLEHLMQGTSNSSSSQLSVYSVQTTKGEVVKAKINKSWLNPNTEELFLMMCEE